MSSESPDLLVTRLSAYYDIPVTRQDLDLPLWKLIVKLNSRVIAAPSEWAL